MQSPLTLDYGAARMFLEVLDTNSVSRQGTNLAAAIRTALASFPEAADKYKAIVLVTDGEDHSGAALKAAEAAARRGIRIYTIGVGGGSIDKNVLEEFAQNTGGKAFFVRKAADLSDVYQRIADELGKQYYLTYSTDNQEWDGRWIKIKVETDRPKTKIRARRGYFAVRGSMLGG